MPQAAPFGNQSGELHGGGPPPAASFPPPPVRPPLKWAGGKRWQLPHLRPLWTPWQQRRLVEPFCGGLAVTLNLRPSRALLNDLNPHLVNFYWWVQRGLSTSLPMANSEDLYYRHRARFNGLLARGEADTAEAAALFYYLNRTGYNGLCRFNRAGEFNVPFGRYKRIAYRSDFSDYVAPFTAFEFTTLDFEALPLQPGDFVYADPPYDVQFRQYSKEGFGWDAQVRTAEWLAKHPGPVVLANQATRRIISLYRRLGYRLIRLSAPRQISCTGNRQPALEVLALRNI